MQNRSKSDKKVTSTTSNSQKQKTEKPVKRRESDEKQKKTAEDACRGSLRARGRGRGRRRSVLTRLLLGQANNTS